MTHYSTDISVSACYSALPGLLASMTERAASLGIADDESLRLQLVIEELFTNTITHGYQGDSEHQVGLALFRHDDVLTLRYEDNAAHFDMTEIEQKTASHTAIGGLGIGLIYGMSKAVRYQRQGQRNVTEIDF
jgi:serine/threonine-protein kinase RsbW